MKGFSILLLACALLTACANPAEGTPEEPSAPANLKLTAEDQKLLARWDPAPGADTYELRCAEGLLSVEGAAPWGQPLSGTRAEITGLRNGAPYSVWVRALNSAGSSPWSGPVQATPDKRPAKPALEAAAGEITVTIKKTTGALSYELWYGTEEDTDLAALYGETPSEGMTVITGLTPGALYVVWTRARGAGGTLPFSAAASIRADAAPGTPAGVTPQLSAGDNALTVTWSAAEGADSYEIWYRKDPGGLYRRAGQAASSPYTVTGLSNGSPCEVMLRARNNAGPGPLSAPQTLALPPSAPPLPRVTASEGKLALSWEAVPGTESYEVWYTELYLNPAEPPLLAGSYPDPRNIEIPLPPGKVYRVWVKAVNAGGGRASPPVTRLLPESFHQSFGALRTWLTSKLENSLSSPYFAALQGLSLDNIAGAPADDGFLPLYQAIGGRFVALDLDACSGSTIGWGTAAAAQNSGARPDKDKIVALTLPANVRKLGKYNFQGCINLKDVQFPQHGRLAVLGEYAFDGCTSLERADLPATLTEIAGGAFNNCTSLQVLLVRAPAPPSLGPNALSGAPASLVIKVPPAAVAAYKTAPAWSAHAPRIAPLEEDE
jgi:hypothetical protein